MMFPVSVILFILSVYIFQEHPLLALSLFLLGVSFLSI